MSPSTVPLLLFLALSIIAIAGARALRFGAINPISVYFLIWSALAVLSIVPALDFRPMRLVTWQLMGLAGFSFALGTVEGWVVTQFFCTRGRGRVAGDEYDSPGKYNEAILDRCYAIGLVCMCGLLALQYQRVRPVVDSLGSIGSVASTEGLVLRKAILTAAFEAAESSLNTGGFVHAFFGYLLFVPAMLTIVWSAHYALRGRWIVAAPPLCLMAVFSAATLERATFIHALLIFLFSFYYHRNHNGLEHGKSGRWLLKSALIFAALAIMIYAPLKVRDPTLTPFGTIDSILEYVVGPLGGLNTYVTYHSFITPVHPSGGTYSFWGAASVFLRLGAPLHLPSNWLEFVPYQQQGDRLTNVYTWLIYFILDFGWLGVALVPFSVGIVSGALHYLVNSRHRSEFIAPLAILMTQLVMSFFAFSLMRDFRFNVLLLCGPVLHRITLMPRISAVPRPNIASKAHEPEYARNDRHPFLQ